MGCNRCKNFYLEKDVKSREYKCPRKRQKTKRPRFKRYQTDSGKLCDTVCTRVILSRELEVEARQILEESVKEYKDGTPIKDVNFMARMWDTEPTVMGKEVRYPSFNSSVSEFTDEVDD